MTNTLIPVVSFEPVKWAACALPKGHADYADYVIRVHYRPAHDQWEIFHAGARQGGHGGKYLGSDGRWSREGHLYDFDTARDLAVNAALTVVVRGLTAADVLAADKWAVVR